MTKRTQSNARAGIVLTLLFFQLPRFESAQTQMGRNGTTAIPLCRLLQSARENDDKLVTITATYRTAFEANELYCLACVQQGAVWISAENSQEARKAAQQMAKILHGHRGTVNGEFNGIFHSRSGSYGHLGSYRYELEVRSVRHLTLVDREGLPPSSLSPNSRQKVCQ